MHNDLYTHGTAASIFDLNLVYDLLQFTGIQRATLLVTELQYLALILTIIYRTIQMVKWVNEYQQRFKEQPALTRLGISPASDKGQ